MNHLNDENNGDKGAPTLNSNIENVFNKKYNQVSGTVNVQAIKRYENWEDTQFSKGHIQFLQ